MQKVIMAVLAILCISVPAFAEIDSNYGVGADIIVLKPGNVIEDVQVQTRYDWESDDLTVMGVVTVDLTQLYQPVGPVTT